MAEYSEDEHREAFVELLAEIGSYAMPFGKYGPKSYPPKGVPLYDLPLEYLLWFRQKGFPKGKLGELMETTCQVKADGADCIFDALRARGGGRTDLRPDRRRSFTFGD